MNNTRFSKLLSELFYRSKSISGVPASFCSAESLLIVAIEKVLSDPQEQDEEIGRLRECLKTTFNDLEVVRNGLLMQLQNKFEPTLSDSLYLSLRAQKAQKIAETKNLSEIPADIFFACILSEPTDAIKMAFSIGNSAAQMNATAWKGGSSEFNTEISSILSNISGSNATQTNGSGEGVAASVGGSQKGDRDKIKSLAELMPRLKKYKTILKNEIFGQDHAIDVFISGYFQATFNAMLDKDRKRPLATYLFAGPPGVGKTFLAETVASEDVLNMPYKRFDMSEFSDKEAVTRLIGSDQVYKDSQEGQLTKFIKENPKCILLFDEIEKAHISAIYLFLQILDAGTLQDAKTNERLSLKDTIIIMTTNAGKQLYEECDNGDFSSVSRKVIINALKNDIDPQTNAPFFPGAICSRFASGNVVMFNHISAHNLEVIAKKNILKAASSVSDQLGIHVHIDDQVYAGVLFSEGCTADARTISSRAKTFLNDELHELFRLMYSEKIDASVESIETVRFDIDVANAADDVKQLFKNGERTQIVMFADDTYVEKCKASVTEHDIIGVQTLEDAVNAIKEYSVDFVVIDMKFGIEDNTASSLNLEDVKSKARDFFRYITENHRHLPIYMIEDETSGLSDEERESFLGLGVRGVLDMSSAADVSFDRQLDAIAAMLYRQQSMDKLGRENKLMTFETSQTISEDGKIAVITLFDLKLIVAVDSEDSKDVLSSVSKPNVSFEDVIGAKDAKKELAYFVSYLKNPKKYMGTGVKAPKGVLLYGPPGTGKTLLAKAMAHESDVTFLVAEGNKFRNSHPGEGSKMVHSLFRKARKYAPSILFIDEIDAIAKERTGYDTESDATLTAFLAEMDGFATDPSKPVFVLAATNFDVEPGSAKSLDSALMRRFDRRVFIDLPDKDDRLCFLNGKRKKNKALASVSDEQLKNIALRSTGMSLAQLDSVVEFALRSTIREGSTVVTDAILEEAFETFNYGEEKPWNKETLERVARHEAGHAFLYWHAGQTPSYMTIVARGHHGGYMQHGDTEDKQIYTKDELLALIRTSMGGRAAEIVYYGEENGITTGPSGDLRSATLRAKHILCTYGMDETFGLAAVDTNSLSGELSLKMYAAVNAILEQQLQEAIFLIRANKDKMDRLVAELLEKDHLTGDEIESVLAD